MTEMEQTMYECQEPLYYDSESYLRWLMLEDERDNPKGEAIIGFAFGEYIYSEVIA